MIRSVSLALFTVLCGLVAACDGRGYSLGGPRDDSSEGPASGSYGAMGRTDASGGRSASGGVRNGGSGGDVSLGGSGGGDGGGAGSGTSGDAGAGGDATEPDCGNGVTEPPDESCDDGNVSPGDGCSASCRAEVVSVTVGAGFACAMSSSGVVKCWGFNRYGELGLEDTQNRGDEPGEMGENLPAVDLGTGRRATSIYAGASHACAVLDDQTVKCWGHNTSGELGLGDSESRGDGPGEMGEALAAVSLGSERRLVDIRMTWEHACALFAGGQAKCWGNNGGRLGLGDLRARGNDPGEMGDDLPEVNLGTGQSAMRVLASIYHSCALLADGSVKCWGGNDTGALGLGDRARRGYSPEQMGDGLPAVTLGSAHHATSIAAGWDATCAILDDDELKCWGFNELGQLGLGDAENRGDEPGEMGDDLPAVDLGTGLWAKRIALGSGVTCAVLSDGSGKCWGANEYGGLGLGDTDNRGDDPGEMGDALPRLDLGSGRGVKEIAVGNTSVCALLDDASVKCWGSNNNGELGVGDIENRGDNPGEMGDYLPAVELGF